MMNKPSNPSIVYRNVLGYVIRKIIQLIIISTILRAISYIGMAVTLYYLLEWMATRP